MTETDLQLAGAQTIREAIAVMNLLPGDPMPIDLNLTVSLPQEQLDQLDRIETLVHQLQEASVALSDTLTQLTNEDAELKSDVEAFIANNQQAQAQVADLQAQLAALQAGALTPEQLAALQTAVDGLAATHSEAAAALPAPAAFVTKTQEDVDTPDADGAEPGSGAFEHYRERLFAYNNGKPEDQQAPSDLDLAAWTALPVG